MRKSSDDFRVARRMPSIGTIAFAIGAMMVFFFLVTTFGKRNDADGRLPQSNEVPAHDSTEKKEDQADPETDLTVAMLGKRVDSELTNGNVENALTAVKEMNELASATLTRLTSEQGDIDQFLENLINGKSDETEKEKVNREFKEAIEDAQLAAEKSKYIVEKAHVEITKAEEKADAPGNGGLLDSMKEAREKAKDYVVAYVSKLESIANIYTFKLHSLANSWSEGRVAAKNQVQAYLNSLIMPASVNAAAFRATVRRTLALPMV
eukprot:Nk52_evm4s1892 gene=Nk52_evmTU4s1892